MTNSIATIKTLILLATLFIGVESSAQQNVILICKDQSGSVQPTEIQQAEEDALLKKHLIEHIKQPGDAVVLSYLYKNTASVTNERVFTWNSPKLSNSDQSDELKTARDRSSQLKSRFGFVNRVVETVKTYQPKSDETRILEALPRLVKWVEKSENVQIIFLSDLIEYSPRRKLLNLNSKQEAEDKAKADIDAIVKDFHLSPSNCPGLMIDCYLPVELMDNRATFQFIQYYWQVVFEQLFQTYNVKFHTL